MENKELEKRMLMEVKEIATTNWRNDPEKLEFALNQIDGSQLRILSKCLIKIKQRLEDELEDISMDHLDTMEKMDLDD